MDYALPAPVVFQRPKIVSPVEWLRDRVNQREKIISRVGVPTSLGSITGNAASNSTVLTLSASVAAGQKVVVFYGGTNFTGVGVTFSDSQSNTWATDYFNNGQAVSFFIGSSQITNALSNTDTITASHAGVSGRLMGAVQVSGLITASAIDQIASQVGTPIGWSSPASGATTIADEIAFGICASDSNSPETNTPGGGYTELFDLTNGGATQLTVQYLILTTTGAQTASGTWTNSGSRSWTAGVATYKGTGEIITPAEVDPDFSQYPKYSMRRAVAPR